ncbi:alpha/beta fold hydrolase [Nocardioides pacificus]
MSALRSPGPGIPDPATDHAPTVHVYDVESGDGTVLQAWTNDPDGLIDGPTVVLCNGLGTNFWAWPALLDPACGVRVVSWFHRGTGGSERPLEAHRVGVEHLVEDALAVMDHAGIERAPLMGWSIGVNTMFELATRHPDRAAGLFAVAGVPGETFATMLRPLHLPRPVRQAVAVSVARVLRYGGPALSPIARRLPIGPRAIAALSHSGFMLPVADPEVTARAVKEFLTTPLDWYGHLALHTHKHDRVSLSQVQVPVFLVAGRYDLMAGAPDMLSAAERLDDATYVELAGSHFLQLEQPEVVHELLVEFLGRLEP